MKRESIIRFISMVALIFGLLIFSLRHFYRYDISKEQIHSLSPSSIPVLKSIHQPADIFVYFNPSHSLTPALKHLLENIKVYCPELNIQWIDPYKDQNILSALGKHGENLGLNSVLMKYGERHRTLTLQDLGLYDRQYESLGLPPQLIGFNGEKSILGALQDICSDEKPLIGLIMNHGERNPNSADNEGISSLIEMLKWKGFHFTLVPLNQLKTLPDNLKILISIQPKIDFSEHELLLLDTWLDQGGKLLLAIDPLISTENNAMMTFNLNLLLKKRGIELQNSIVVDPSKQIPFSRADHLYIDQFGDSPVTEHLRQLPALLFQCRSLKVSQTETHHLFPLLGTTSSGWGESDFLNPNYEFDPSRDFAGPVLVGAAAFNPDSKERLIVYGDSDFLSNFQFKQGSNALLAESSFEWLSQNDHFEALKPRLFPDLKTNLSVGDMKYIFWALVLIPFFWGAACGLILKRRKNNARSARQSA